MPRCPNCDAPIRKLSSPTAVAPAPAQVCGTCGETFAETETVYDETDLNLLPFAELDEAEISLEELLF